MRWGKVCGNILSLQFELKKWVTFWISKWWVIISLRVVQRLYFHNLRVFKNNNINSVNEQYMATLSNSHPPIRVPFSSIKRCLTTPLSMNILYRYVRRPINAARQSLTIPKAAAKSPLPSAVKKKRKKSEKNKQIWCLHWKDLKIRPSIIITSCPFKALFHASLKNDV